ncbi:MAG: phosphotransferase, partial [Anaerolineae bacterium]|nr:phosphotransferase [Anaerolineae bacterium]
MTISAFTHPQIEALLAKFAPQAKLLNVRPLTGGYSAQIVAFGYRLANGQMAQAVLRLHGEIDFTANPNIAADEFRLLHVLTRAGLPVPTPIYLDTACDIFATPCLVIGFVDGQPDFTPADVPATVRQMAAQLAALHQIRAENEVAFLPRQADICAAKLHTPPDAPDFSLSEDRIRAALLAA